MGEAMQTLLVAIALIGAIAVFATWWLTGGNDDDDDGGYA